MKNLIKQSGSIEKDGFLLNYQIEGKGNGTPVIIIGNTNYYPRVFSNNIKEKLKLVFIDHRGFAKCLKDKTTNADFELDDILEDIEYIREHLNLGKSIILGHSGHAYMALEYAKKYPQNTLSVTMVGIAPSMSEKSQLLIDQYWNELADNARKEKLKNNHESVTESELSKLSPLDRFIKDYILNGPKIWFDYNYDSAPLWKDVYLNMDMFEYVWGQVFPNLNILDGLKDFDIPVQVCVGKYDFLVAPPQTWEDVKKHFKHLELVAFDKSGHTPQYEEPELFDSAILSFINKHQLEVVNS